MYTCSMHLMIDLETLATSPNAAILTIGACKFDPKAQDIHSQYYERIVLESQESYGRIINEKTHKTHRRRAQTKAENGRTGNGQD